MPLSRPICS